MLADLYLRKSSADGGKSVAQQDEECADGVAGKGWTVGRRFTDDNRSASRYARKRREDYEALVAHIASGHCEALVMWETARGGRREVTYFQLLELCREQGTKIYITTHDRLYDLSRRSDWRSLAQEVIDSADLSGKISENTQRGKRRIAREGKPAGRLLYGYTREYDPHTREYVRQVEHPEQAPVVRRLAAGVIARKTSAKLADELTAEGILTATGKRWRGRDIGRLLQNPAYVRGRVHQGELLTDVEADWPAILDKDTWRKCCRILGDPDRRTQDGSELRHMLSGVPRCGRGECDGVLRPHRGNQAVRYTCVKCTSIAVSERDLDDYISAVVIERLGRPDAVDVFRPRRDDAALRAAEDKVVELRGELEAWKALAKARRVSPASFADFEADLLPQIAAAQRQVRSLELPPPLPELEGMEAVDVAARWSDLAVHTRRGVVRLLMSIRVLPSAKRGARFSPDRVEITWRT